MEERCMNKRLNSHSIQLTSIPEEYITLDLCLKAIEIDPLQLYHVPNSLRDGVYHYFIDNEDFLWSFMIPSEYITDEYLVKAIRAGFIEDVLEHLLSRNLTDEMIDVLIAYADKFPMECETLDNGGNEVCCVYSITDIIGEHKLTQDLCNTLVETNIDNFSQIPMKYRTKELCMRAFDGIKCIGHTLFPDYIYTDQEFIDKVVERCDTDKTAWTICQNIPNDMIAEQHWIHLVDLYPQLLHVMPEQYKTVDICRDAIEKDGLLVQCVPEKLLVENDGLWMTAISNDLAANKYIPESITTTNKYKRYLDELIKTAIEDIENTPL